MIEKISVNINVIIHATEDVTKFDDSFKEIFNLDAKNFTQQSFEGHHGNQIILYSIQIVKKSARDFIDKLTQKIDAVYIEQNIQSMIQDSTLYLRIDKQEFINGSISFREDNAIKIKIQTPIYHKKDTVKIFSSLFRQLG